MWLWCVGVSACLLREYLIIRTHNIQIDIQTHKPPYKTDKIGKDSYRRTTITTYYLLLLLLVITITTTITTTAAITATALRASANLVLVECLCGWEGGWCM